MCDRTSTGISWRIPFHQLFHERMLVHRTGGLERVFLAITLHSRVNNEVKTLWKVLSTCNATVHKKIKDSPSLIKDLQCYLWPQKTGNISIHINRIDLCANIYGLVQRTSKVNKKAHLNHPIKQSIMILIRYCYLEHGK